jgi:hypothetical protein
MSYFEIRKAVADDVESLLHIKRMLPLTMHDGNKTTGGFLLGSSPEQYEHHILHDQCIVALAGTGIIGFGIMMYNDSVRRSDIWLRRHHATWRIDIADFELLPICYFEQLAFLPGYSRAVLNLAYHMVVGAFEAGHHALFTTTVHKPILNLAAVPYIKKGGGVLAGSIYEDYPEIGEILSDIYVMERDVFTLQVPKLEIFPYLQTMLKRTAIQDGNNALYTLMK